jgi:hypothetical protein
MAVTSIAFKCNLKSTFNKQSVCFRKQVDHDGYQEDEIGAGCGSLLAAFLTS